MSRTERLGSLMFGVEGKQYSNVNFARSYAEEIADRTKKDVDVYHIYNGNRGLTVFTIKPKNRLTLVTE